LSLFFDQTGDELLSDSFPYKEIENGMLWEVEGKVLFLNKALSFFFLRSKLVEFKLMYHCYSFLCSLVGCERSYGFWHRCESVDFV